MLKCFADRLQDWADVESVVRKQKNLQDWAYINGELTILCELKEDLEIVEKLRELRRRLT